MERRARLPPRRGFRVLRAAPAPRTAYRQRAQERPLAFLRDIDGLVKRHMGYLVVEDGLGC